jgi:hypothetical protein
MSIQRWGSIGPDDWTTPSAHGKYVLYSDHVAAVAEAVAEATIVEFTRGQVQMMDEIARCIGDGHRGNDNAEDDLCCQICQEIQCDLDCAVAVSRAAVAAAEQRWNIDLADEAAAQYEHGRDEALDAVREALELLPLSLVDTRFDPDDDRRYVQAVRLTTALAAIDALTKGEQT